MRDEFLYMRKKAIKSHKTAGFMFIRGETVVFGMRKCVQHEFHSTWRRNSNFIASASKTRLKYAGTAPASALKIWENDFKNWSNVPTLNGALDAFSLEKLHKC